MTITKHEVRYTLADVKEFLNTLSEEQLRQPMCISIDDMPDQFMRAHGIVREDIIMKITDPDDWGTEASFEEKYEEDYDRSDYITMAPKGQIYFY